MTFPQDINSVNFTDPNEGVPLADICPMSDRAFSLMARSKNLPVLQNSFINIFGAIEMMKGLTYHHARFMEHIASCYRTASSLKIEEAIRHEAVAYLNRLGQFWMFAESDLVKEICPTIKEVLPTIDKFIVFRHKHTAHRSIDKPRKDDSEGLQVMNAISLSILGGSLFGLKAGHSESDLSEMETEKDYGIFKRDLFKNNYLMFQIYDAQSETHVNFSMERDHESIMAEAYELIRIILSPSH